METTETETGQKSETQNRILRLLPRAEWIFAPAAIIAATGGDSSLAVVGLSGLGAVYFLNSNRPANVEAGEQPMGFGSLLALNILPRVLWISCAVCLTGILFYLLNLAGAPNVALIGSTTIVAGTVLTLALVITAPSYVRHILPVLARAVVLAAANAYYLLTDPAFSFTPRG